MATTGDRWQTLCPNLAEDRAKIDALWTEWVNAMPYVDVWHIFPGDPGACSLPEHVDPRPHGTTSKLIDFFRSFR